MTVEPIRLLAFALAVSGVYLNNHRNAWCFACWLVSNAIWFVVDYQAKIYEQAAQHLLFLGLAAHGWWCWRRKR